MENATITATLLPLDQIVLLPEFRLRFEYEVGDLMESIRSTGQNEPGHVVSLPGGKKFGLYIGRRRYEAMRRLFAETREQRFSLYKAFIDEGYSQERMWKMALDENREGVRLGLSALEWISTMRRAELSPYSGHYKRYSSLAANPMLDDEGVGKLHAMEVAAGFRFSLEHLEGLAAECADGREFLLTAAILADVRAPSTQIDFIRARLEAAQAIRWLPKVLPEFATEQPAGRAAYESALKLIEERQTKRAPVEAAQQSRPGSTTTEVPAPGGAESGTGVVVPPAPVDRLSGGQGPDEKHRQTAASPEHVEYGVVFENCPHCGAPFPLIVQGGTSTFLIPDLFPGQGRDAIEPASTLRATKECTNCDRPFWWAVKPLSKPTGPGNAVYNLAIKVSKVPVLDDPTVEAIVCDVKRNFRNGTWEKYDRDGAFLGALEVDPDHAKKR